MRNTILSKYPPFSPFTLSRLGARGQFLLDQKESQKSKNLLGYTGYL